MKTNFLINIDKQNNDTRKTEKIDIHNMDVNEEFEGMTTGMVQIIIEKITYSICALMLLFMIVISAWSAVIFTLEIDCKTAPLQYCLEPIIKKCLN